MVFSLVVDWCRISIVRCSIFRWVPFLGLDFERAFIFFSTSAEYLPIRLEKDALLFYFLFLYFFNFFLKRVANDGGNGEKEERKKGRTRLASESSLNHA